MVASFSAKAQQEPYSFLSVIQAGIPVDFIYSPSILNRLNTANTKNRDLEKFESALPLLQFYANRLISSDLPAGYALIPIIESNNTPKAVSRVGAAGVWQLMPDTATRYGLRVDFYEDERYLVSQATSAATKHIRYLTKLFNHPVYVLAAYNWGEQNVLNLLKTTRSVDAFMTSSKLPEETRGYVLRVLGFWYSLLSLDADHSLHYYPNVSYFNVDMSSDVNFSSDANIQSFLNPLQSISRERLVPTSFFYTYFQSKVGEAVKRRDSDRTCVNAQSIKNYKVYVVQDGDSHERIIKRFGVVEQELRNEVKSMRLQPGLIVRVPTLDSSRQYGRGGCP